MIKNENLSLFGKEKIQITQKELNEAKLKNNKDTEVLELPTFSSITK